MKGKWMKKSTLIIGLGLVVIMLLIGCQTAKEETEEGSSEGQTEEEKEDKKEEGKIYGYITPGPDTWYQRDVDGFTMGAENDGNKVVVLNSDYDADKEISNIDSLINQGVDGICIFPFNETGAKIAAEKCAEAGIPLVATDTCGTALDAEADIVAAIDFDWAEMGINYADWMAENHPGEKFVIITGNFESVPCQRVNEAMQNRAKELGKNELVELREGKYNPSEAVNVAQDLISSGKEFSIIFVMDEDMAAAVIQMLKANNALDEYTVIAQNGSPAGLPLVKEGSLSYTISSSPGWEGLVSYLALANNVTGKSTEMEQSILLPIMPVNQDNIDDESKVVPWEVNDIFWNLTKEYFPELLNE